jgi:hypothetical protein
VDRHAGNGEGELDSEVPGEEGAAAVAFSIAEHLPSTVRRQ